MSESYRRLSNRDLSTQGASAQQQLEAHLRRAEELQPGVAKLVKTGWLKVDATPFVQMAAPSGGRPRQGIRIELRYDGESLGPALEIPGEPTARPQAVLKAASQALDGLARNGGRAAQVAEQAASLKDSEPPPTQIRPGPVGSGPSSISSFVSALADERDARNLTKVRQVVAEVLSERRRLEELAPFPRMHQAVREELRRQQGRGVTTSPQSGPDGRADHSTPGEPSHLEPG